MKIVYNFLGCKIDFAFFSEFLSITAMKRVIVMT